MDYITMFLIVLSCFLGGLIVFSRQERFVPQLYFIIFVLASGMNFRAINLGMLVIIILTYFCVELICKKMRGYEKESARDKYGFSLIVKVNLAVAFSIFAYILNKPLIISSVNSITPITVMMLFFLTAIFIFATKEEKE